MSDDANLFYPCSVCGKPMASTDDECPHCAQGPEEDQPEAVVKPEGRNRPNISHLELAVEVNEDGTVHFIPEVGGQVVIERVASILPGSPWLSTALYTVREVDRETGALKLFCPEYGHFAQSNYIEGLLHGYSFRLPPKKGPIAKRKTRKPVVKPDPVVTAPVTKTVSLAPEAEPVVKTKTGKGRPKGSKNRDKATIRAEKEARSEARKAKRMAKARKVAKSPKKTVSKKKR